MANPRTEPPYNAAGDANQFPSTTFTSGSVGTSDTTGTAEVVRWGGNPATGAGYVEVIGGVSVSGGSNVNIVTGTQQTLGTIGVVNSIAAGTQNTLGTVGTVNGVGTVTNLGSVTNVGNLFGGTINAGTVDTEFPAATLLADGAASPTTTTVGAFNFIRDTVNGDWDFVVRAAAAADSTGAGIVASGVMYQFDDTTPSSVTENRFAHARMSSRRVPYSEGPIPHDTADAANPHKIGMKAVALKANPTEVAAGDVTDWLAGVHGVPFVLGGHPNILSQSLQVTDADGAQTDTAIITVAANVAIVVTKISVMADNANTADVSVRIGFGVTNTPAADAAQVILFHPGIAPGSGVVEGSGAGILGVGASNEDLRVTCEDPVGGSINITVTYFTTDI